MSEDNPSESAIAVALPRLSAVERSYALTITGSDGRRERGSRAALEYILFVDGTSSDHVQEIVDSLSVCEGRQIADVEVKDLRTHVMNYFKNDREIIFPSRVIDSRFVCGSADVHYAAKSRLVSEWIAPESGFRIAERLRHRRSEFRQVIDRGGVQRFNKGTILTHYSLEEGVSYYDPAKKVVSFKGGPLRYVQYALVYELIKFGRKVGPVQSMELLGKMPSSTIEKINYLSQRGRLAVSPGEQNSLIESYGFFLDHYHQAQEAAGLSGTATTKFDKPMVREMLKDMSRILRKEVIR